MIWLLVLCLDILIALQTINANAVQGVAVRRAGIHLPLVRKGYHLHQKRGDGSTAIGLGDVLDVYVYSLILTDQT